MLLETEANLRKEARDSHPQFSASWDAWKDDVDKMRRKKKGTACIFRPERSFELKLNGNRGQELQTSVRLAPLLCRFRTNQQG